MLSEDTRQRIDAAVASDEVVLFMKGTRQAPQCGFSATVVQILDDLLPEYRTIDVLADNEMRQGIKDYSAWPTIPQLYVKGEFLGGCDVVRELYGTGGLHAKLGLPAPERKVPTLHVGDRAANFLRDAVERSGGQVLHLRIDARFQNRAYLGPAEPGEIGAEAAGLTIHLDLPSAQRADGIRIEFVEGRHGHDLRIDNPNAPPGVRQMDVHELQRLLGSGEPMRLVDVRTPEERAKASIPGSQLLDPDTEAALVGLPKDTLLVLHCHHGGRSQQAAERFVAQGFRNVYNVVGGIDAWSEKIDPSVPRY